MKALAAALVLLAAEGPNDAGTAQQIDPKLAPIAQNLAEFAKDFRWRNFQMLTEESLDLAFQSAAQVELPGSRSVQVTPRQMSPDGRIKVHLELLGEHPEHSRKLHTDYTIQRGGTIFVGGLRLDPAKPEAGTLLVAITQGMGGD